MKIILAVAVALTALLPTSPALAQSRNEVRDRIQEHRIRQGYENGQLSEREARRLGRQHERIDRYRDHSQNDDGRLSLRERRNIDRMQDRASRRIYRQRRD